MPTIVTLGADDHIAGRTVSHSIRGVRSAGIGRGPAGDWREVGTAQPRLSELCRESVKGDCRVFCKN